MIYERPDKIMSSNKSLEAEIMSCCCCSNGKSKIEVNFEKNGYSYG